MHTLPHVLSRADGSIQYGSPNGHCIIAAVNGPLEVQRRDELPEEAHIEVNVRPHSSVGQVKERHLETVTSSVLRDVIITQSFPRQMVQVTFQVLKVPTSDYAMGMTNHQAGSYLPILPSLLNAACLALLDAAVPIRYTFSSTLLAIMAEGKIEAQPSLETIRAANGLHVLTYSSKGELLLAESEGRFGMDDWDALEDHARIVCVGDVDAMIEDKKGNPILDEIKTTVVEKVRHNERRRDG